MISLGSACFNVFLFSCSQCTIGLVYAVCGGSPVFPFPHRRFRIGVGFEGWRSRCDLPDGVAGAQTDPLGNGTILALSLSKLLLGAEGLVALLKIDGLENDFEIRVFFLLLFISERQMATGTIGVLNFDRGCTYRHLEG